MLDRYVRAFETVRPGLLVSLLREDIVIEMPPVPLWMVGIEPVLRFLTERFPVCGAVPPAGDLGERPARVRRLPAAGGRRVRARGIHVLRLTAAGIDHLVSFLDPSLFPAFELPPALPADA